MVKKIGLYILILLISLVLMGCRVGFVEGDSMEPTLSHDEFIVYKLTDKLLPGELVVFRHNGLFSVKRVVGVEGDFIYVDMGGIYLNNKRLDVDYVTEVPRSWRVGVDELFVLGDNMEASTDSLAYGCIDLEDVLGRVFFGGI